MKIYRIANDTKAVQFDCTQTGIHIICYYGKNIVNCCLFESDGSFVDEFNNFWHARNWAKKHLNKDCNISIYGRDL